MYPVSYSGMESLLPAFPVVGGTTTSKNEHAAVRVPTLGEHSVEILTSLGYGQDNLSALAAEGVVFTGKGRAAGIADSEPSRPASDR
jgi:hypothetical protein